MKNKRVLESYYNLFYYQLSSSAGLTLLRSHPSSMKGVLNFVITDAIDSQYGLTLLRSHPSSMKGVLNFVITDAIDSQFC